jgi:hypothetical protein
MAKMTKTETLNRGVELTKLHAPNQFKCPPVVFNGGFKAGKINLGKDFLTARRRLAALANLTNIGRVTIK